MIKAGRSAKPRGWRHYSVHRAFDEGSEEIIRRLREQCDRNAIKK